MDLPPCRLSGMSVGNLVWVQGLSVEAAAVPTTSPPRLPPSEGGSVLNPATRLLLGLNTRLADGCADVPVSVSVCVCVCMYACLRVYTYMYSHAHGLTT